MSQKAPTSENYKLIPLTTVENAWHVYSRKLCSHFSKSKRKKKTDFRCVHSERKWRFAVQMKCRRIPFAQSVEPSVKGKGLKVYCFITFLWLLVGKVFLEVEIERNKNVSILHEQFISICSINSNQYTFSNKYTTPHIKLPLIKRRNKE